MTLHSQSIICGKLLHTHRNFESTQSNDLSGVFVTRTKCGVFVTRTKSFVFVTHTAILMWAVIEEMLHWYKQPSIGKETVLCFTSCVNTRVRCHWQEDGATDETAIGIWENDGIIGFGMGVWKPPTLLDYSWSFRSKTLFLWSFLPFPALVQFISTRPLLVSDYLWLEGI